MMKCVICKQGETRVGKTTMTLERGSFTMVMKSVPAQVCQNCGEAYVDEATTKALLKTAEREAKAGSQVEVRAYAMA